MLLPRAAPGAVSGRGQRRHIAGRSATTPMARQQAAARPRRSGGRAAAAPERAAASHDGEPSTSHDAEPSTSSASACPFAGGAAAEPPPAGAAEVAGLAGLSGPGWRVLPRGNAAGLPRATGAWCWNPLLGDYGDIAARGVGAFLLERFRRFGPVFNFKLGQQTLTAVMDYDATKSLLQSGDSKVMAGWNPPALYAMLGEGARANLEDPVARQRSRKLMSPGFSREALAGYFDKIERIVTRQLDAWVDGGGVVDLREQGKALSFEFSSQLLVDFEIPEAAKPELKTKFDALFQGMFAAPINLPGTTFARGLRAKAELQQDILKAMRASGSGAGGSSGSSRSVLQYNLAARRETLAGGGELTDQATAEAGIGLIIAGNDTSGLGITALLALLPLFPDVMRQLRAEQEQVVAKFGPELSVASVEAMSYASAVVREALRVAPPATQIMRKTRVDLEVLGTFVPAGSVLYFSALVGQMLTDPRLAQSLTPEALAELSDADWYALNAESLARDFRPERWLTGAAAAAAAGAGGGEPPARPSGLLTFSAGPHICLGLSLYMTEAVTLLALIARGYELELESPAELSFDVAFVTQLRSRAQLRVRRRAAVAAAPQTREPVAAA
ncbi:cyp26b1 [Scenedesmus sp. PABB004]|nr:cyp26b1 [Scenedesmus sp. PABB004]